MEQTSYSASQAAKILGVSIPTLKGLCKGGRLISFQTPGGHLRIPADSLNAIGQEAESKTRSVVSSPLNIRRERVEEKKLEIEELRLKNEEVRIRTEQEAREKQSRDAARIAELKRQARVEERRREREAADAIRALEEQAAEGRRLRAEVLEESEKLLPAWATPEQHQQAIDEMEALVDKYGIEDSGRIRRLLKGLMERFVSQLQAERQIVDRRARILESTMWKMNVHATAAERGQASRSIRDALDLLALSRTETEERAAAEDAICELNQEIQERVSAINARRQSEAEAQSRKNAEQHAKWVEDAKLATQKNQIDRLVSTGMTVVSIYLTQLETEAEDAEDGDLIAEINDEDQTLFNTVVEERLREQITGSETYDQIAKLARAIVDQELKG
jgi:hypothetical protein